MTYFMFMNFLNNMKIPNNNDKIKKDIMNNKHNNITTIFNLLKKKYNEGRFNYNILKKNDTDDFKRIKLLKRYKQNKLNKTLNSETNYINNENIIGNIINKVNENKNNIIIINNNNNLVSQPNNYLLNTILTDNKDINSEKYKKILKKIDTSISREKNYRNDITINVSNSPEIDLDKAHIFKCNPKIKEKRIIYKKYINTSLNQNNSKQNKNDNSTLKADSFNINIREKNNEKEFNLYKSNFNEYQKKLKPTSHLKTLTNLQFYTLNKSKDNNHNQYNTKICLKNRSFINNSLIYGKNELKKKTINSSMAEKDKDQFFLNLNKISPDNKIYTKYFNYYNNKIDTSGNEVNFSKIEKMNSINSHTNKSLINEIKKELKQDIKSKRNSINARDNFINNHLFQSLNIKEDNTSTKSINKSYKNSKSKTNIKKIIQIGKENYYKKLKANKLRDERKKIKVNKLLTLNEKLLNNQTFDINYILSERGRYPKKIYINKTLNTDNNNDNKKRLKFKIKEFTDINKFKNYLAYSKKICTKNKSFVKNKTHYYIISTSLSISEICKRIIDFCSNNRLLYQRNNSKYTIIIEEVNSFIIDIKSTEEGNVLKFSHDKGDEKKTKEYLISLYSKIAN